MIMEIDEEIKNKINQLSTTITNALLEKGSAFINIQIEEEFSQYDVLFSYNYSNIGIHQRGIKSDSLLIGIIGCGCFGFDINIPDTDPGYYAEKLRVHSMFLAMLFNEIRKKLKKSQ